jgi:hypothetical protein
MVSGAFPGFIVHQSELQQNPKVIFGHILELGIFCRPKLRISQRKL